MPADGVVIETPATCDADTCDPDAATPPIRCGVARVVGRRAAEPFSSDWTASASVAVVAEAAPVGKWAETVAEPDMGAEPATTTTSLPSEGSTFSMGLVPVAVVAVSVDCPMPQ